METKRKLLNYLPHYMREYAEMRQIMEAEQPEIDILWSAAEGVLADQFILDATANGVKRWESLLGVSPKDTDTLDERKFRLLTLLNQELPYTMRKLEQTLTNLCGANGYSIILTAANYHITVKLALENANNYVEVEKTLKKMIPANMVQEIVIMYNANSILKQYTHAELAAYTHDQIRSEVFS